MDLYDKAVKDMSCSHGSDLQCLRILEKVSISPLIDYCIRSVKRFSMALYGKQRNIYQIYTLGKKYLLPECRLTLIIADF